LKTRKLSGRDCGKGEDKEKEGVERGQGRIDMGKLNEKEVLW
jgi:hypothetical protein